MNSHEQRGSIDKIKDFLSSTKNLVLTLGALASALAAIVALAPKGASTRESPLEASFSGVKAYPYVSLSQFDVRSGETEAPERSPAPTKIGAVLYRLLADRAGTSTSPRRTARARIEHGTGAPRGKVVEVLNALSTSNQTTGETKPSEPSEGPTESSQTQTQASTTSAPATATETTGPTVTAETATTTGQTTTTSAETTGPRTSEHTRSPTETTQPGVEIVIPDSCRIAFCGATEEIDKALTDSPNAATAAAAVAELFRDSRAEIVGRKLYPIGVAVGYSLKLDGWAHRRATLRWSLWSEGDNQALPRPWWRNITVAQITPARSSETLNGEFWVPIPPKRGDYFVDLKVYDAKGVSHADSESSPLVH
jgi:hypothetical protein